ncbi:TPA: efflux RND transporter periplasmic adaptor subunit [Candidatus Sumerlaeota bacterium]|nr:efflux RND transporter periplasmic adaptor subunit [Candidatus Sumerlaeota bacterium]
MPPKKIIKKVTFILTPVLGLTLTLAYMTGAFHKKIEPGKIALSKITLENNQPTDVVHKVIQTQQARIVGTVRAKKRSEISPRIMARILEIKVRAGDRVKEGDLLARLDDADLKANAERMRQAMAEAEGNLQTAAKDADRMSKLYAEKAVSEKEHDEADLRMRSAQTQVKQTSESLSSARTAQSYAVIIAPFSGVVVDRQMDVGDTTQPGKALFTLYDPSEMRLEAAVPEMLATTLKVGEKLQVAMEGANAPDKQPIQGTIEEVVPQADALSRSVLVKVILPVGTPGAVDGAFGRLLVPDMERVRICVPTSAVKEAGQLAYITVVQHDGSLERRMVQLGERSPYGRVEALSGVESGERVVLYGPPPQPLPDGVRLFGE